MNLTCVVKESPEPPQYIFWYRDEQVWRVSNVHVSSPQQHYTLFNTFVSSFEFIREDVFICVYYLYGVKIFSSQMCGFCVDKSFWGVCKCTENSNERMWKLGTNIKGTK